MENVANSRWRVVREQPQEEDAPVRFAVMRGDRRVAWGLRDRAAARRWLRRLRPSHVTALAPSAAITAASAAAGLTTAQGPAALGAA